MDSKVEKEVDQATRDLVTKGDLANVKGDLKTEIASSKSEMIKWMFIFWIGTVVTLVGSFITIFKFAGIL